MYSDAHTLGLVTPACVLTAQILHDLHSIFTGVCSDFESRPVEFAGEDDHVHLLVNYPPKIAVVPPS
jgi:putative transposase